MHVGMQVVWILNIANLDIGSFCTVKDSLPSIIEFLQVSIHFAAVLALICLIIKSKRL